MPVTLGTPRPAHDVVDLLLECHERIRSFTALADRLAHTPGLAPAEVADAAAQVRRYFTEALPLHARDEEESVLPRLTGRDPLVDRELVAMTAEHGDHGPILARVVEACDALAATPERHAEVAPELGRAARQLAMHFAAHLAREEEVVFPAVRALPPVERAAIVAELRARRAPPPSPPGQAAGHPGIDNRPTPH